MNITIPLNPITKKNSSQIIQCKGRSMIIPSKQYRQYEKDCKPYLAEMLIDYPVNVKCLYYMPTKRKVDITNLLSATDDILVKHGVLVDDNRNIVASHDGSRVYYDKVNPRVEIEITPLEDYEIWRSK